MNPFKVLHQNLSFTEVMGPIQRPLTFLKFNQGITYDEDKLHLIKIVNPKLFERILNDVSFSQVINLNLILI